MANQHEQITNALGVITHQIKTWSALEDYANQRISYYRQQLEQAENIESVLKYQGAIKELRRILQLKEIVEQSRKDTKG